ncbi:MAG: hypothetical protein R8G33_07075 [Gammaproteobacteria bacterium]|nr:hypothetical protein [Gammaproteobacteria bacterium]
MIRLRYFNHTLILIVSFIVSGCASTQTKEANTNEVYPFSAQGWGGTTCTELIHDITPKNVGFQQAVQNIRLYQSWASGFVSGVNYSESDVYDVSGATSPEDTFIWLKDYCADNLETAIPIALHELLVIWQQEGKTLREAN